MIDLIDTHCHLTGLSKDKFKEIMINAKQASVNRVICIGASNGMDPNFEAFNLAQENKNCYATIGIHPHDADNHTWSDKLESLLEHKKVVAVGETGLDFFKNWSDFTNQEKLFRKTISIAKNIKKPLVIHCRDAHKKAISILKEEKAEQIGGVFHCYSEDEETAKILKNMNFLISLTGIITFKKLHDLRESISKIPLDQLMLETDSPYMAPEPFRGKESQPAHVKLIAESLAKIHNTTIEEVAKKTTQNAESFFGLGDLILQNN